MKKLRLTYTFVFLALLCVEILIALFVRDNFIRPYVGDVLVTVLICCFMRIFIPRGVVALPAYVFVFAAIVELCQYFDIVKLLGLESNRFISIIIGRTFSFADLVCYAVGCLLFFCADRFIKRFL